MRFAVPSSAGTGRGFQFSEISGHSTLSQDLPMLFAVDLHANPTQAPQPGDTEARKMTATSGQRLCALFDKSSRVGSFLRMLLTSTEWGSSKWFLFWKGTGTKSRRRLKFRLVPSDTITTGRASGFVATPTETANQDCPSMQKWPGCQNVEVTPEAWERRMGYPEGWTDLDYPLSETRLYPTSPNRLGEP
jgi:hypothetical protein